MEGFDQELDVAYRRDRDHFFQKLKEFHKARGTPFLRIPTFGGQTLDLYALYNTVISYGGISVVTDKKKWGQVFRTLGFPPCTNAAYALKQHYSRYLEAYEKIFFLGEDTDDSNTTRSYAQSLKYRRLNKAPKLGPLGEPLVDNFNHISYSLQSGLQNEVDFALNICSLLSNVPNSIFNLAKSPTILDLMLGHVGIYAKDELAMKHLIDEWYSNSDKDFGKFWRNSLNNQVARDIYEENNFDSSSLEENYKMDEKNTKLFVGKNDIMQVNSPECCRINQVCIILYNFSFEQMNAMHLSSHDGAIRFLLLAACCIHNNVQRTALDALDNISNYMLIRGVEDSFTQKYFDLLNKFLVSNDKFRRCRAMSILAKLASREDNKNVLTQVLSEDIYKILVETLYLPDIALILASLDTLYCFTNLNDIVATGIAMIHGSVDILMCLISVRAESFGNKAIKGYRIIENKHSMFTPKNQLWIKSQEEKRLARQLSMSLPREHDSPAPQRNFVQKPHHRQLPGPGAFPNPLHPSINSNPLGNNPTNNNPIGNHQLTNYNLVNDHRTNNIPINNYLLNNMAANNYPLNSISGSHQATDINSHMVNILLHKQSNNMLTSNPSLHNIPRNSSPRSIHSYNHRMYDMAVNNSPMRLTNPINHQIDSSMDDFIEVDAATYAANWMSGYYEPHPSNMLFISVIYDDYVKCCKEISREGILPLVEFVKVLRSIIPPHLAQILPPDREGKIGISGIIRRKAPLHVQNKFHKLMQDDCNSKNNVATSAATTVTSQAHALSDSSIVAKKLFPILNEDSCDSIPDSVYSNSSRSEIIGEESVRANPLAKEGDIRQKVAACEDLKPSGKSDENVHAIALGLSKNLYNGEHSNEGEEVMEKLKSEMQAHFMQFHMHRQHIQAIQMQIQQLMQQTQPDNLPSNVIKDIQIRIQTHHIQMQSHYQRLQQLNLLSGQVQNKLQMEKVNMKIKTSGSAQNIMLSSLNKSVISCPETSHVNTLRKVDNLDSIHVTSNAMSKVNTDADQSHFKTDNCNSTHTDSSSCTEAITTTVQSTSFPDQFTKTSTSSNISATSNTVIQGLSLPDDSKCETAVVDTTTTPVQIHSSNSTTAPVNMSSYVTSNTIQCQSPPAASNVIHVASNDIPVASNVLPVASNIIHGASNGIPVTSDLCSKVSTSAIPSQSLSGDNISTPVTSDICTRTNTSTIQSQSYPNTTYVSEIKSAQSTINSNSVGISTPYIEPLLSNVTRSISITSSSMGTKSTLNDKVSSSSESSLRQKVHPFIVPPAFPFMQSNMVSIQHGIPNGSFMSPPCSPVPVKGGKGPSRSGAESPGKGGKKSRNAKSSRRVKKSTLTQEFDMQQKVLMNGFVSLTNDHLLSSPFQTASGTTPRFPSINSPIIGQCNTGVVSGVLRNPFTHSLSPDMIPGYPYKNSRGKSQMKPAVRRDNYPNGIDIRSNLSHPTSKPFISAKGVENNLNSSNHIFSHFPKGTDKAFKPQGGPNLPSETHASVLDGNIFDFRNMNGNASPESSSGITISSSITKPNYIVENLESAPKKLKTNHIGLEESSAENVVENYPNKLKIPISLDSTRPYIARTQNYITVAQVGTTDTSVNAPTFNMEKTFVKSLDSVVLKGKLVDNSTPTCINGTIPVASKNDGYFQLTRTDSLTYAVSSVTASVVTKSAIPIHKDTTPRLNDVERKISNSKNDSDDDIDFLKVEDKESTDLNYERLSSAKNGITLSSNISSVNGHIYQTNDNIRLNQEPPQYDCGTFTNQKSHLISNVQNTDEKLKNSTPSKANVSNKPVTTPTLSPRFTESQNSILSTQSSKDDNLEFHRCNWESCKLPPFINATSLLAHMIQVHAPIEGQVAACNVPGCSSIKKPRRVMISHFQEKHCLRRNKDGLMSIVPLPKLSLSRSNVWKFEEESPVTRSVRHTAALILRNIARFSSYGRKLISSHEDMLAMVAISSSEAATAAAQCLLEISNASDEVDDSGS